MTKENNMKENTPKKNMNKKFIIKYDPTYSLEKMFGHFDQALAGKKHLQPKNVIVMSDQATIRRVISQARLSLLDYLKKEPVKNIYQLAKALNRDYANVWRDCQVLTSLGIIKLKKTENKELKPIVCYEEIVVEFPVNQENKITPSRRKHLSALKPTSEQEQIKIHQSIKTDKGRTCYAYECN